MVIAAKQCQGVRGWCNSTLYIEIADAGSSGTRCQLKHRRGLYFDVCIVSGRMFTFVLPCLVYLCCSQDKMHGVVKFDPRTGIQQKGATKAGSYTNYFADALIAEAERDSRIVAIHAAMAGGTGGRLAG